MSNELIFYTNPTSRGRIVRWMLEEVGCPYETRVLDYGTTMKAEDYLQINPMGKVPALVHGETVITESAAICAYLADAFPDADLAPPCSNPLKGDYYRWLFFAAGPLEAAVIDKALGRDVDEEQRKMVGYGKLEDILAMLEGAVMGRDYLVGDSFTAADVYVASHLGWGMQFGLLDKRPAFETYVNKLMGRPDAIRARELDDALIPPQEG
jgi:glutathione S-transferase